MTRSVWFGDVRTGKRALALPVVECPWAMLHRGGGHLTPEIPLGAKELKQLVDAGDGTWKPGTKVRDAVLNAVDPARCYAAILEGDQVLEAGPIWTHRYDPTTRRLKVGAGDFWSLLDHRLVMAVVADGAAAAAWSVQYTDLSLETHAKRLIQLLETHTGGDLPVVLPDDVAGTHQRTWNGYDLGTAADRLRALMNVIDGPDLAFTPRLTTARDGIEWVLTTGNQTDPMVHQHSGDRVWDSRAPKSQVGQIHVHVDATEMAGRSWVSGAGLKEDTLLAFADDTTLTDAGYPLLEAVDNRPNVEESTTAASWASTNLAAHKRPWMAWTLRVRADRSPRLGTYRPGDWAKVWVPADHDYLTHRLPAGYHRARILRVDGDMSPWVTLTLAPQIEAR